jgi:hypothetical protein
MKLRAGEPFTSVSAWLSERDAPITRNALRRHATGHLGIGSRPSGPRPMSDDLAEAIRDRVKQRLADGTVEPTIGDGLKAVSLLDRRAQRDADRDWMLKISMLLSGHAVAPLVLTAESEAIEAEFRPLLEATT